jgi:hypothetical protein
MKAITRASLAGVALTALLGVATVGNATGKTTRSGLYGVVKRGPTAPVCRVGEPCDAPAPNVTLLFLRSGRVVARTRTDELGRYRITLRPATYAVRTTQKLFGRIPKPPRVTVPSGRYARVNFFIDTGIR